MDWAAILKAHYLELPMSCRGNCYGSKRRRGLHHAAAESFFNLLARERIWKKAYKIREKARQDVFDCIEMFYNPKHKHVQNEMLSPVEFEWQGRPIRQGF